MVIRVIPNENIGRFSLETLRPDESLACSITTGRFKPIVEFTRDKPAVFYNPILKSYFSGENSKLYPPMYSEDRTPACVNEVAKFFDIFKLVYTDLVTSEKYKWAIITIF